jgi:hypothetical protein
MNMKEYIEIREEEEEEEEDGDKNTHTLHTCEVRRSVGQ